MASNRAAARAGNVRDLLMYRIARLATIGDRTGQARISAQFGLNLGEWRALSVVCAFAPVTLARLADELYLDKGQLSRSISDLIDRGLVSHSSSPQDRRQTLFALTAEGRRLHDRILAFAIERNATYMQGLSGAERAQLLRLLDKVMATAASSYDEVFSLQARQAVRKASPRSNPGRVERGATRAVRRGVSREGGRTDRGRAVVRAGSQ